MCRYVMLCHVTLSYGMLCCIKLWCAMCHYVMLCYVALSYGMLCYTKL